MWNLFLSFYWGLESDFAVLFFPSVYIFLPLEIFSFDYSWLSTPTGCRCLFLFLCGFSLGLKARPLFYIGRRLCVVKISFSFGSNSDSPSWQPFSPSTFPDLSEPIDGQHFSFLPRPWRAFFLLRAYFRPLFAAGVVLV